MQFNEINGQSFLSPEYCLQAFKRAYPYAKVNNITPFFSMASEGELFNNEISAPNTYFIGYCNADFRNSYLPIIIHDLDSNHFNNGMYVTECGLLSFKAAYADIGFTFVGYAIQYDSFTPILFSVDPTPIQPQPEPSVVICGNTIYTYIKNNVKYYWCGFIKNNAPKRLVWKNSELTNWQDISSNPAIGDNSFISNQMADIYGTNIQFQIQTWNGTSWVQFLQNPTFTPVTDNDIILQDNGITGQIFLKFPCKPNWVAQNMAGFTVPTISNYQTTFWYGYTPNEVTTGVQSDTFYSLQEYQSVEVGNRYFIDPQCTIPVHYDFIKPYLQGNVYYSVNDGYLTAEFRV